MISLELLVRRLARTVVNGVLIGAGIGFLLWLGNQGESPLHIYLLVGSWFGLCVTSAVNLLMFSLGDLLERPSGWRQRLMLAVGLFVVASLGWAVGFLTLPLVSSDRLNPGEASWLQALTLGGGLGVVLGLAFVSYQRLKTRLEKSIALIKEQEYAARELETARQIQSRILPPPVIEGSGYRIAARNEPARVVAGDFYDAFPQADGSMGLVVGDVAGKGVGASLVMASVKAALPLLAVDRSVAETLDELNRKLLDQLGPREFVALCYVRYQPASGELELANAGLPDPYLLHPDAAAQALSVTGPRLPLGARAGTGYQTLKSRLRPGDRLLLLSDGLPEALTSEDEPLGYERLEALLSHGDDSAEDWLDGLFTRVEQQTSATPDDDRTALVLEHRAASSKE